MRSAARGPLGWLPLAVLCCVPIFLCTACWLGGAPLGSVPGFEGLYLIRSFEFVRPGEEIGVVPYELHMWPDEVPFDGSLDSDHTLHAYLAVEDQTLWNHESAPVRTLYFARDDVNFRVVNGGVKQGSSVIELEVLNRGDSQMPVEIAGAQLSSLEDGTRQEPDGVGIAVPGMHGTANSGTVCIAGLSLRTFRMVHFAEISGGVTVLPDERKRIAFVFDRPYPDSVDFGLKLTRSAWADPIEVRLRLVRVDYRDYHALPEWKGQGDEELPPTISADFSPLWPPTSRR